MYYRLKPDCTLVRGALRGAIYDFSTGKVYSISPSALSLFDSLQNNYLEEVLDLNSDTQALSFLDRATKRGIGSYYFANPPATIKDTPPEDVNLEFLWLELTSNCNNRCLHCYASAEPCANQNTLNHQTWISVIEQAKSLGATSLQLIGGEPLLYPNWQDLIKKAVQENYEYIEIFTNATLIKPEDILFFKEHNVRIATTIYSDNAEIHDLITQNPGSFAATMSAIDMITQANIPLRIASIIMKQNESEVEGIMKLCEKIGVDANMPDVIRPTGRGNDLDLLPESYKKLPIQPPFFTDKYSFIQAHRYNSCLAGKLAITAEGDVIPCIFARDIICGNVNSQPLADIIAENSRLQNCWHLTKDKITKCQDCEYRYACTDCRPLAQSLAADNNWLACTAGCSYNPHIGKWEEK